MSSGYEDRTGFVIVSFEFSLRPGQRKVPETSGMSASVIVRSTDGCQITHETCWRASGKEAKAYPTIHTPTNYTNWGVVQSELDALCGKRKGLYTARRKNPTSTDLSPAILSINQPIKTLRWELKVCRRIEADGPAIRQKLLEPLPTPP